jgi:hypothetical protein
LRDFTRSATTPHAYELGQFQKEKKKVS